MLHELRARQSYGGVGGKILFWRTPSGKEVDFIWSRGRKHVGFEVKASARWRSSFSRSLRELHREGAIQRAFGVYLGDDELRDGPVRVLPYSKFAHALARGDIIA